MPRGILAALLCAGLAGLPATAPAADPAHASARVEIAFAPDEDLAAFVVERIARARHGVQLQAYLFTDRRIANALIAARRRGVEVEVVADGAQHRSGGLPHLKALARAGARVFLDDEHPAAHNKVVIVDGDRPQAVVITGSYNFTPSAASRNAENVVALSGSRAVAGRFVANFNAHKERSTRWP